MRELKLEALTPPRIDQAYPLVQLVRPRLDAAGWRAYAAERLAAPESGIVLLSDARGLILGLFVWQVALDPDHGRTLCCEDFVALDIVDSDGVAQTLADGVEETARARDCTAVHISIAATGGPAARRMVDRLRGLGHRMESFQLCKRLTAAC